jgi:hypothetical protein
VTAPRRLRDDASARPDQRALLRGASASKPLPKEVRARSASRVDRMLVVPAAAAGFFFWIKGVAVAAACAVGAVAAVRVAPALVQRWAASSAEIARSPAPPRRSGPAGSAELRSDPPPAGTPGSASASASASAQAPVAPAAAAHDPPRRPEPARTAPPPMDALAREAAMLEEARALLDRDPGGALSALDRYAAAFPSGSLGIERELLAVAALRKLGRDREAQIRGAALLERARGSIYEERVTTLLKPVSSP